MQKIKWDGISEIEKIKPALLGFITESEKQQAQKTAYGYFTDIIRKNHRNSATNNGGFLVSGFFDKVTVSVGKIEYFMTWNKAAKYICQWLNQEEIMENQVIITENYNRAVSLHRRICANAQAAQESLYEVCKGLKEMRDGKLYKELGYQNFEDYTQTELGIKRHMAQKYIAIAGIENGESIHQIGVTKLALLAKLDEPERQEIIQNTDLESTSVKQLKEEISRLKADNASEIDSMKTRHNQEKADFMREKNELRKQLEELEKDRRDWIDANRENVELTKQISSLERQIEELENRPVEVAVKDNSEEIEKLKNQLEQEKQKVKIREIPDNSEIFEIYYQNCIDSIEKLFGFLRNKNLKSFNKRLYELSDILNDNISMLDEY